LPLSSLPERAGDPWLRPVMPGCLHEQTAHVAVPRLRDAPPALPLPARVLRRDQSQVGHELPGRGEALDVVDLGHDPHRRHRVDSPEAPQPRHRLPPRLLLRPLHQRQVQTLQALGPLVEGQQVGLEDRLAARVVEVQGPQPVQVPRTPVMRRLPVDAVTPEQELAPAVPGPEQVLLSVFPAPGEIPQRLLRLARRLDPRPAAARPAARPACARPAGPS